MKPIETWVLDEERRKLHDGLLPILGSALELSRSLRGQRACWSLHLPLPGTLFNSQTMKDKDDDEDSDDDEMKQYGHTTRQRVVEIAITPGLFKRGTSDGERYESETCIVRAEVRCVDIRVENEMRESTQAH